MNYRRIIPCLDVKNGRLVKGINFIRLKDVGDPAESAAAYSEAGADELVFLDITATVEGRKTLLGAVKKTVDAIPPSLPLTVGGGIGSCKAIEELLNLGVSKVSINTAAVKNPDLIKEAAKKFGKDKLVVAIDGKKNPKSSKSPRLEVVIKSGTEGTGLDIVKWSKQVEKLGAGEILLTSKDADGTKKGYDLEMTKACAEAVSIPVTASGGAGKLEHLYEAVTIGKASAVLCASVFHFGEISIPEAKKYLKKRGIPVRL